MDPFAEMIRKYNLRFNDKINKFCQPISTGFGVNHFFFYVVTKDGYYTCLSSNVQWAEYYFSEKLYLPNPYLRNPDNFDSGISYVRHIDDSTFQKSVDIGVNKFNVCQSLVFLEKTNEGVQGFGFSTHIPQETFEALSLNEMPFLKFFVKKFKEEFNDLLYKMKDDCVDIASLIGPSFYKKETCIRPAAINKELFLKQFQLAEILDLSAREKEVLFYISKGLTTSCIADQLLLSKRTVEHYVENIKIKLNCYTKSDLIQKGNDFLSLGFSLA